MHANRRKICCLVALLMLITGMCFENIKADSCLGYTFIEGSALVQVQNTTLNAQSTNIPETLVARYMPSMRQVIHPVVHIRRDWKVACILLCEIEGYNLLLKFFSTEVPVYLYDTVHHAVVVNYIHSMDGKKRI